MTIKLLQGIREESSQMGLGGCAGISKKPKTEKEWRKAENMIKL